MVTRAVPLPHSQEDFLCIFCAKQAILLTRKEPLRHTCLSLLLRKGVSFAPFVSYELEGERAKLWVAQTPAPTLGLVVGGWTAG